MVLQMMDPKMDSGFLAGEDTLEDEYDVLQKILPEELVGIMDQMLCYEVSESTECRECVNAPRI